MLITERRLNTVGNTVTCGRGAGSLPQQTSKLAAWLKGLCCCISRGACCDDGQGRARQLLDACDRPPALLHQPWNLGSQLLGRCAFVVACRVQGACSSATTSGLRVLEQGSSGRLGLIKGSFTPWQQAV
jgi:hypothetical protein